MNLFKAFPCFGATILWQRNDQAGYSTLAHVLGWAYHFSNGATFGVMYLAMIGAPMQLSSGQELTEHQIASLGI